MIGYFLKITLVLLVFGFVIAATYPTRRMAYEEQQANDYDTLIERQTQKAAQVYKDAQQHPENKLAIIEARDQYANMLWQRRNLEDTSKLLNQQLADTWPLVAGAYNEKWVNASLRLANVYRDMSVDGAALVCYESVLQHDKTFLKENDERIIRDLNNLGLIHYLIGSGIQEKEKRRAEFSKAKEYLDKALIDLEKSKQGDSAKVLPTLWNLYLVERDLGNPKTALELKERATALDKKMNRVCRAP